MSTDDVRVSRNAQVALIKMHERRRRRAEYLLQTHKLEQLRAEGLVQYLPPSGADTIGSWPRRRRK